MVALLLVFQGTSILFSVVAIPVSILTNSVKGFLFSTPSSALIICSPFDYSHSDQCYSLTCISLLISDVEHRFMSKNILPVFSSSFVLSCTIFRSLNHFELIFVYGVRECSNFIDLHLAVQHPNITCWRNCLFSIVYSCLLCHSCVNYTAILCNWL